MKRIYLLFATIGIVGGYFAAPGLLPLVNQALYGDKVIKIHHKPTPKKTTPKKGLPPKIQSKANNITLYTFGDKTATSYIGKLLEEAEYLTDKLPNRHAEYYLFLHSASWCGPCRAGMPAIAAEYRNIHATGVVELILLSHDSNADKALRFLSENKADFPVIFHQQWRKQLAPQLPKLREVKGIPTVNFYKADGTFITKGHGSEVRKWRAHTLASSIPTHDAGEQPESGAGRAHTPVCSIPAHDAGEQPESGAGRAQTQASSIPTLLPHISYVSGSPSTEAEYYIILYATSWGEPYHSGIRAIIREYKKLKKKNIEIILACHAPTKKEAEKFVRKHKIPFPVAMADDLRELPGYIVPNNFPHAVFADKSGRHLAQGHAKIIHKWKKIIDQDNITPLKK